MRFQTKPRLAWKMIAAALDAGIRAPWVTGDLMAPAHHPRHARLGLLTARASDAAPERPASTHHLVHSRDPITLAAVPEIRHLLGAARNSPAMAAARLCTGQTGADATRPQPGAATDHQRTHWADHETTLEYYR